MKRSFWGAALASTMLLSSNHEARHSQSTPAESSVAALREVLPERATSAFQNAAYAHGKNGPYEAADFIRRLPDSANSKSGIIHFDVSQSPSLSDFSMTGNTLLDPLGSLLTPGPFNLFSPPPRIYPKRDVPFAHHTGSMVGHIDGSGQQSLCERLVGQASGKQFLAFADTNHGIPEIHEFVASDDLIRTLANNNYKHIFLEIPIFLQDLVDEFAAGQISEDLFNMVSNSVCHMIHATPETLPRFLKAHADTIRLANAYGMKVHYIDHGPGDVDPEHADLLNRIYKRQIQLYKEMLQQNPQLMENGVQQNVPELATALFGIARGRDLKKLPFDELMAFADAMSWDPDEGAPLTGQDRLRYRLVEGDPQLAHNIGCLAGSERAMILYGQWHMTRAQGDLDASLGDQNTFVVDLYGCLDTQQRDEQIANIHYINLMGETPREDADAAVCLATQTLMTPDGHYVVFGQKGPPRHIDPAAGMLAKKPGAPPNEAEFLFANLDFHVGQ